jgi:hypothetical protein
VPITNSGPTCTLGIPHLVQVATPDGAQHRVAVADAMTTTTFVAKRGQTFTAIIGASWAFPGWPTPSPCVAPIDNVVRVALPVEGGVLDIALDMAWKEVCSSPASVSLEYTH